MKIKKGFILRVVGGESIVVPVGEASKNFHGMINLNETGAFLWRFFTEEHTAEEAVAALCAEYEATSEQVEQDVARFMKILADNGFCEA